MTLSATIIGNPTKAYDGTTAATLTPANFQLVGVLPGESVSISQTAGTYNISDVTASTVSATLSASALAPGAGTLAIDYALPGSASGAGAIFAKALTAAIVGNPTKTYDGTNAATLTPANFQSTGLAAGQSLSIVTQSKRASTTARTPAARHGEHELVGQQLHRRLPGTLCQRLHAADICQRAWHDSRQDDRRPAIITRSRPRFPTAAHRAIPPLTAGQFPVDRTDRQGRASRSPRPRALTTARTPRPPR